jgi:hypothetical protein
MVTDTTTYIVPPTTSEIRVLTTSSTYDVVTGIQTFSYEQDIDQTSPGGPAGLCIEHYVFSEVGSLTVNYALTIVGAPPPGSIQITSAKISQGQPPDDGSSGEVALVLNRDAVVELTASSTGSVPNPDSIPVRISLGSQPDATVRVPRNVCSRIGTHLRTL